MISETLKNQFWRKSLKAWAAEAREGSIDRREFLALATIFGASTAAAYGMLGLAAPTPAFAETPKKGGVIECGMFVKDQKDPRTYDWPEMGNVARQFLEFARAATPANSPSSRRCSRNGTSTPTRPNTSCTCARA